MRRLAGLVGTKLVLIAACALAMAYAGANWAAASYGVSREAMISRVRSNDLVVRLPADRARPFDASAEEMMYVSYEDVPDIMRDAILASEDSRFFIHPGVDPVGVVNAALSLLSDSPRGGSTITQQLAKQHFVGAERTPGRKIAEMGVALWLEWHFSKEELLEFYYNTPFMGHGTKGLEAAARYYFDYSFKKEGHQDVSFTPDMAASLAVAIKNPTRGNPRTAANMRQARRLLLAMGIEPETLTVEAVEDEDLPRRFAAAAFADEGRLSDQFSPARDLAVAELAAGLGDDERVLDVVTFYSSEIQLYLEHAVALHRPRLRAAGYDRLAATVVDNRTGGVRAVLAQPGERIYPGSTVKPLLVLCPIVTWGWSETTPVEDVPVGEPPVGNHDGRYHGRIGLGEAMATSRNPPFVTMMRRFGADCPNAMMAGIGAAFRFEGASGRSLALGAEPVDLAAIVEAYVAIASCGRVTNAPRFVAEARDRATQEVVLRHVPAAMPEDPEMLAGLDRLHVILNRVTGPGGTAENSRFVRDVAAKTGTADGSRQITLVTFTPAYTVLVTAEATDPGALTRRLSSSALVPLVRNVNANIHPDGYKEPLGCAAPPAVVASR